MGSGKCKYTEFYHVIKRQTPLNQDGEEFVWLFSSPLCSQNSVSFEADGDETEEEMETRPLRMKV